MFDARVRFRAPPEWAQRKREMLAEQQRKAKQAKQRKEQDEHRAALERQEAARLQRLNRMHLDDASEAGQ